MSAYEPFTAAARRAMFLGQEVAVRAGSSEIGTEHIVCGVLEIDESPLLPLFEERGLSIDAFRERVAREPVPLEPPRELTFTADAKGLIESSFAEARAVGAELIGPEMLVGALVQHPESVASRYLRELGFDLDAVRERMHEQVRSQRSPARTGLTSARRSYLRAELAEEDLLADPLEQLAQWIDHAVQAKHVEPNAMCVSTVDARGRPSSRMVLLRGLDERGLIFYTSYLSRKGENLSANPHVAAAFYWGEIERQVRIEGTAEQVSDEESDAYFASRPRGHQLAAWASEQSEPVESRELLDQRIEDYEARFEGEEVPRPHSWGGYLIRPQRIEFWQGRKNRMHDRLEFLKEGTTWKLRRLSP